MQNEDKLAQLWFKIATISPQSIYAGINQGLLNDSQAQPGYVGSDYESGRILFVGMYPGGDSKGHDNQAVYQAIRMLDGTADSFWYLNNVLRNEISSDINPWSIWQYMKPILQGAGYSIDEIALINLCPWRYKEYWRLYSPCWSNFVQEQIDELAPRHIVALGSQQSGVGYHLGKFTTSYPIHYSFHHANAKRSINKFF